MKTTLKTTFHERVDWADKIRKARDSRGWTQLALAKAAEVSLAAVQKLERGTDGGIRMFTHLMWIMENNHVDTRAHRQSVLESKRRK